MTPRLARLGAAAALATVALGPSCVPAQARTPTPTHVAVFVDGVGSACVPWHSGMTGADVLGAKFDVVYGQPTPGGNYAGMVVQVDGVPTDPNPHTAYWAYFHNTGSGWQYSGSGALSTHPQPGTVEGWRLDSAATSAHPAPAAASYASICAGQDAAPTRPTPAPPTRTATSSPGPSTHASSPRATATATRAAAAGGQHAAASSGSTKQARALRPVVGRASTPAVTTSATAAGTVPVPSLTPASTPVALTHQGSSSVPTWGTALAISVVVALGGVALWRARTRTRRGAP